MQDWTAQITLKSQSNLSPSFRGDPMRNWRIGDDNSAAADEAVKQSPQILAVNDGDGHRVEIEFVEQV